MKKKEKTVIVVAKMHESVFTELLYMPISMLKIDSNLVKDEQFEVIGKLVKKVHDLKPKK